MSRDQHEWFAYSRGRRDFETFATAKEAEQCVEEWLNEDRREARDSWCDSPGGIWGRIHGVTVMTESLDPETECTKECRESECKGEFDECDECPFAWCSADGFAEYAVMPPAGIPPVKLTRRGKLRNTTNPAPQEKNSAPLLSGADCVQTTQAEGFPPARNIGSPASEPCSDQSGPRGGANHHG